MSYREMVNVTNMSTIGAFDIIECYEVFVLSIRAIYTLVMLFTCANEHCGIIGELHNSNNLDQYDEFLHPPLKTLDDHNIIIIIILF